MRRIVSYHKEFKNIIIFRNINNVFHIVTALLYKQEHLEVQYFVHNEEPALFFYYTI